MGDIKDGLTEQGTISSDDAIFCVKDARVCPLTVQLELDGAIVPLILKLILELLSLYFQTVQDRNFFHRFV